MSQIEVNKIIPQSGTTVQFGESGDTINVVGTLDGSGLTGLNASNISTGTLNDARLSANVTLLGASPTYSGISPTTALPSTATNITVTGTGFTATTIFELVSTAGAIITPNSVTLNSATSVTMNVTATGGTYFIRIENDSGLATRSTNADLSVSQAPSFSTSAGTLGSFDAGASINVAITASSDSAVDFSKTSGTFPGGLSLGNTQNTVYLAGTNSGTSATTTFNFTIRATDQESQTADRAFSMTINVGMNESMRFI